MDAVEKLEGRQFLEGLNDILANAVGPFAGAPSEGDDHLSLMVVGLPRSGTTLVTQLLAATGDMGYVSNVMATCWRAPIIGARLHRHLLGGRAPRAYSSQGGRTDGPEGPHEFGAFWRWARGHSSNALVQDRRPGLTMPELDQLLRAITRVFEAPTVYKDFLAMSYGEEMRTQLPSSRFVVVEREPDEVATSLLALRRRHGKLMGVHPRGHVMSPDDVVDTAAQVRGLLGQLETFRSDIGERAMVVNYRDLCADPRGTVNAIRRHLCFGPADVAIIPDRFAPSFGDDRTTVSDLARLRRELER